MISPTTPAKLSRSRVAGGAASERDGGGCYVILFLEHRFGIVGRYLKLNALDFYAVRMSFVYGYERTVCMNK